MTLQGIVKGYNGLIITRTLLGLTESGFFPAATYLSVYSNLISMAEYYPLP